MPVCPECGSSKVEQLNDRWWLACRECGITFRLYAVERAEDVERAVVARLESMVRNLRLKGDHFHANRVEKFKAEYIRGLSNDWAT